MFKFTGKVVLALLFAIFMAVVYQRWCLIPYDPRTLTGKRVLITGSSSGIGEQLAYQYAELGVRLVLTGRRANLLEFVASKCRKEGALQVDVVPADMALPEDRAKLIARTQKLLGGLDHLILNHADIGHDLWHSQPKDLSALRRTMEVNFMSYADLSSRAMPLLEASNGSIAVVSSILGQVGQVASVAYSSSKFALFGFFNSLRMELALRGSGVSITTVVFGIVNTKSAITQINKHYSNFDISHCGMAPEAAHTILRGVSTRTREVYYPMLAYTVSIAHSLVPGIVESFFTSTVSDSLKTWKK